MVEWRTQVPVAGVRVRLTVNGQVVSEPGPGAVQGRFAATAGDNRIEIEVLDGRRPGRVVLALKGRTLEPGSLRVVSGAGAAVSADSISVPFGAAPTERAVIVFRSRR